VGSSRVVLRLLLRIELRASRGLHAEDGLWASALLAFYDFNLYLIIKYVRFPSSTTFFRPICPPTKIHNTHNATGKKKKSVKPKRLGTQTRTRPGLHVWVPSLNVYDVIQRLLYVI
jgi:hypothetical protein